MSTNGRWFQSYWTKKGGYVVPRESGWYAAIPENCSNCIVRVHLEPNLYHCKAEGDDFVRDVYDYRFWYKLKSPYDTLPDPP